MASSKSYYDILGVKQDASLENIQKARESLKFGDSDDRAPFSMWGKIDEAYNVLSNAEKRREYDKKIEENKDIYSHSNHGSSSNSGNSNGTSLPDDSKQNGDNKNSGSNTAGNGSNKGNEEKEYDLNFVSEFKPEEKVKKTNDSKTKTVAKYVGGTLVGYLVAGPIGAIAVPIWMKKHKKVSLQKDNKTKKMTKISTASMEGLTEKTNTILHGGQIFDEVQPLLEEAQLGSKMVWDPDTLSHTFKIYKGMDLTNRIHAVVFSDEQGTAKDLVINDDDSTLKNFAYVKGQLSDGTEFVETVGTATGDNRREIWFDTSVYQEQDEAVDDCKARAVAYATMELGKRIRRQSFSVAIDASELGTLYNIGDVVSCAGGSCSCFAPKMLPIISPIFWPIFT